MKVRTRQTFSLILGLVVMAAVLCGALATMRAALEMLGSLDSAIATAIVAAAGAALVSVLSVVLGKLYESRILVKKEHRDKKIPVYEDLIALTFRILKGTKTGQVVPEGEMIELMSGITQRIMVWGSDDVLATWARWRRVLISNLEEPEPDPTKTMLLYENLILAIRRDLGHKNKALNTGDVLVLFINDIDQYLANSD